MSWIATQVTQADLGGDTVIFPAGQSHLIHAIIVNNTTSAARTCQIREADLTTPIMDFDVPSESTVIVDIKWICDRGLAIDGVSQLLVPIWIYHNSPGV